jgi:hypothetical protein
VPKHPSPQSHLQELPGGLIKAVLNMLQHQNKGCRADTLSTPSQIQLSMQAQHKCWGSDMLGWHDAAGNYCRKLLQEVAAAAKMPSTQPP